jgi:AAA ATPase containing von Willebrand factor type A (vWA) domain
MIPYIIKALLKNDSVCVNDLGTFTIHYVPASIQGKTILAPHNEITLDPNNVYDEYAFTNLVCFEKKCLITQANQEITQWVEELKNALEHNKSVSFDQFGTFAMNDKGRISFTCDYIPELNQEFEGMEDLNTAMLWKGNEEEKEAVSEIDEEENRENVKVVEPESEPKPEPVVETNEEEQKEEVQEETPEVEPIEKEEPVVYRSELAGETEQSEEVPVAAEPEMEPEPVVETNEEKPKEEVQEETPEVKPVEEEEPEVYRSELAGETEHSEEMPVAEPEMEPEPVVETNEEEHKEEVQEETPEVETFEEEEPEKPETDTDDVKRHRSRWWLWLLIVLLILAALGTADYLLRNKIRPVFDNVKEKFSEKEQVVNPSESDGSETIDIIEPAENVEEEIVEEDVEEESAPEVYVPETVKKTVDGKYPYIRFETGHFYTIVGSLPSEGDAEKHIRNRGLDKYEPMLVLQNGVGNIRVCVGIFDSEEEAESFGKNTGLKYWVLK